ncbi:A/G-specific adenine glycosylase [Tepidimonas charontis]|uniref:Adenine DNA glycosylase n=1 Tax=Tepidimonas charontis TaxID=2267262 RepID=A0A554XFP1_9BURK|nr:A/G-specific adenine glycosylase [Tepidimonas charontis]TSE34650.1 Adenine DNA glycosylase [Tepidimonas charontis]
MGTNEPVTTVAGEHGDGQVGRLALDHVTAGGAASDLFARVVAWQRRCGRHDLPWQRTRDPYRVWLSEIMLQQTQVRTVRGYYERFLQRFPDVQALAAAELDEVLALWSGLGYYSRARHLHACARWVVQRYGGRFPADADALAALPGIGPSTAAAIAAFCFGQRRSILDGNVRRVLTRLWAWDDTTAAGRRRLWQAAQDAIAPTASAEDMAAYTQGLMDLGATVCTRSRPRCGACPLADRCAAHGAGQPEAWPRPRPATARQSLTWWLPLFEAPDGRWWLQRRPGRGVWAGLWAPPVLTAAPALAAWRQAGVEVRAETPFRHALTHRELTLHPLRCRWGWGRGPDDRGSPPALPAEVGAPDQGAWWSPAQALSLGLPAPVRRWLQKLVSDSCPSNSR